MKGLAGTQACWFETFPLQIHFRRLVDEFCTSKAWSEVSWLVTACARRRWKNDSIKWIVTVGSSFRAVKFPSHKILKELLNKEFSRNFHVDWRVIQNEINFKSSAWKCWWLRNVKENCRQQNQDKLFFELICTLVGCLCTIQFNLKFQKVFLPKANLCKLPILDDLNVVEDSNVLTKRTPNDAICIHKILTVIASGLKCIIWTLG